jgi:hypothetical protein
VVIVVFIAASSAVAAYEAVTRLAHPRLAAALVHADPQPREGADHHAVLASHR